MKNIARLFLASWYLLGWISHVYLALAIPAMYRSFGTTALLPYLRDLWQSVVMPHIILFVLILALFELSVGLIPLLFSTFDQLLQEAVFSFFQWPVLCIDPILG